ncbi:MAG: gliding motility lipoprotein GldH [Prevotella sp.]|nr:gliding motility lipoprotein GldH [Prevotella sp.]
MKVKDYTLLYIGSLLAMFIGLEACQKNRTFDHYEHTQLSGWERNDTLLFDIPPQKAGTYELNIGIRATQTFPYKSVCLIIERTVFPNMETRKEIVRCPIIDDYGLLIGKNGISNSELSYHLADITLQEHDSMHIKLHHCMRRETLPGISEIGIQLIKQN